jgi:CheY-like chemotaxis protein
VLIVDDDPAVCRLFARALGREHEVRVAHNGREALAVLAADPAFDVVLSDLDMPEMSGPELFAALQREHPGLLPAVIAMTGGTLHTGLGVPVLQKPVAV